MTRTCKGWQAVAEATGLGERRVKRGMRNGTLPGALIEGVYLVTPGELESFLDGNWSPRPQQQPAPVLIATRKQAA